MKRIRSIAAVAALAACVVLLRPLRESTVYGANPVSSQEAAASPDVKGTATIQPQSSPTWSRDVASVLYKNCTTCHHTGGAGPFSLLTYADARRWGPQLMTVTQSRFMPPWLPEPGYGDFADVRRLSDHERDLIKQWVLAKMPQGDPAVAPAPPHYDANWLMGKPDLILKVARPFTLPGGGTDVFRNFILPYPLKETHYIRAMEIRPGTPQIVHHANITVDRTGGLRRQFPNDWQNGVAGMELMVDAGNRFDPDSHFLFWKPDTPALVEPAGMPWRLDPGNDLILNMHLKPSGKSETLDAEVGLYFTPDAPAKQPMLIDLERDDALDIPAGAANFVVEDSLTLPVDVDVFGVYPHAHYLGRDMQGWAILPNGEKKWLVWIRNWDIDRQAVYRYKEPVLLPKGTVLHMRYTYDNSSTNVHNPHSPPVRVRAGNRSEDEMAHLWFQVLPINVQPGAPDPRLFLEETWMRDRLRKTPNDQVSLYNFAAALAGQGKFAEAVSAFEKELNQSPSDERTLTALGVALEGEGDWSQAIEKLRKAIALNSGACNARFDLANIELRHNQLSGAEADFRSQLSACPEDAEVHDALAAILQAENRTAAAQAEFRRSLELAPDDLPALLGLAQINLAASRTDTAVQLLKHATSSTPTSVEAHEQLASAYGQTGDLPSALSELRTAARLKPDDPVLHSALAQVLTATGSLKEATEEQRIALKLLENDPDGWNNLGVLEVRTGQTDAARADFEHALRLQPDHAQAKANLEHLKGQPSNSNE
jgi:Flp pilus assembly protein TadD/mono/diheme cytochrome c family protein